MMVEKLNCYLRVDSKGKHMDTPNDLRWVILPGMRFFFESYINAALANISKNNKGSRNRPLLVIGDTGTGKTMMADTYIQLFAKVNKIKSVHRVNCAAFTETLIDSELFGHVKGAFTGATNEKIGILESSSNSLVILDEIGELSENIQAKLLVFIEDGYFRKVGSTTLQKSSAILFATTNKTREYFREDFWFRFNPVFVPPFYKRRLDALCYIYMKNKNLFFKLKPSSALHILAYNWPGNAREIDRLIDDMSFRDAMEDPHLRQLYDDLNLNPAHSEYTFNDQIDSNISDIGKVDRMHLGNYVVKSGYDLISLNETLSMLGIGLPFSINPGGEISNFSQIMQEKEDYYSGKTKYESINERWDTKEQWLSMVKGMKSTDAWTGADDTFFSAKEKNPLLEYIKHPVLEGFYFAEPCNLHRLIEIGFSTFCNIFFRDPEQDSHILENHDLSTWAAPIDYSVMRVTKRIHRKKLLLPLMKVMTGRNIINRGEIAFHKSWSGLIRDLNISNDDAFFGTKKQECNLPEQKNDDKDITEEKHLKKYYSDLIKSSKTHVEAAKKAGLNYSTFRSKLRKFGLLAAKKKRT